MIRTIRRVGVIGLGKMGNPMSRHLLAKGFEVISTPEEMTSRIRDEGRKWARVIRESGLRPD